MMSENKRNTEQIDFVAKDEKAKKRLKKIIEKSGYKKNELAKLIGFTDYKGLDKVLSRTGILTDDKAEALSNLLGIRFEYIKCEDDYLNDYSKNWQAGLHKFRDKNKAFFESKKRIERVSDIYDIPNIEADSTYWESFVKYLDSTIIDAIIRYFNSMPITKDDIELLTFEKYVKPVELCNEPIDDKDELSIDEEFSLFDYEWKHNETRKE